MFREVQSAQGKVTIARAHFRDSDGVNRPVTASGRTQTIAQRALLHKLDSRASRSLTGKVKTTARISDLADIYAASLESNTRLKPQTKARYIQSARGAITRAFPEVTVSELTVGMVERFIMGLANTDHVSEARNCRVVLRAMMRLAVADDAINQNPVAMADIRLPVSTKSARALTADELILLRNLVAAYRTGPNVQGPKQSPDLKDALDTMLGTGLRISEVLAVRAEDIGFLDDGRATLNVRATIIFENGKGSRRQDSTKTGKSRSLTVAPWVAVLLRGRAAASRSGLLWETQRTAKPYQQQNLLRDLRSIVKDTDLEWVTSHSLRKTAGTIIAKILGVSAATSALGHSSDAITRRIYIDEVQTPTDLSAAMAGLAPIARATVAITSRVNRE
jgi:integrase